MERSFSPYASPVSGAPVFAPAEASRSWPRPQDSIRLPVNPANRERLRQLRRAELEAWAAIPPRTSIMLKPRASGSAGAQDHEAPRKSVRHAWLRAAAHSDSRLYLVMGLLVTALAIWAFIDWSSVFGSWDRWVNFVIRLYS